MRRVLGSVASSAWINKRILYLKTSNLEGIGRYTTIDDFLKMDILASRECMASDCWSSLQVLEVVQVELC